MIENSWGERKHFNPNVKKGESVNIEGNRTIKAKEGMLLSLSDCKKNLLRIERGGD